MHERIKEHDRDIWFTRTQTFAVSEYAHETDHYPLWNEVKFIDRAGFIGTPIAWMPTIKKNNRRVVQQRTAEGATSCRNSEDRNAPITADHPDINGAV